MKKNSSQIQRHYYPALDGLRGLACLAVVIYHNFEFVQKYFFFGWVTVDLFFTLSAFLITDILIKSVNRPNYLKNFYCRRLLRIFPLYYLTLIIFLVVLPQFNTKLKLEYYIENQIYIWTYLQNWLFIFIPPIETDSLNHLWSLAVEEQFYIVWPFIILIIKKPKLLLFAILFILISLFGVRLWVWLMHFPNLYYYNLFPFTRIDGICVGSIVAILNSYSSGFLSKKTKFIIYITIGINLIFYIFNYTNNNQLPYLALFGYTSVAVFMGLIINKVIHEEFQFINDFLNLSFLRFIGKVSYGLYVFHWPIYRGIGPFISEWSGRFIDQLYASFLASIITSFLALIICWLSFKYFETPFLKMKTRFA